MRAPRRAASSTCLGIGSTSCSITGLRERRDEVVVDEHDTVDLLLDVQLATLWASACASAYAGRSLKPVQAVSTSKRRKRSEERPRLPPTSQRTAIPSACSSCSSANDVAQHLGVERAREAAVAGQRQDRDRARLAAAGGAAARAPRRPRGPSRPSAPASGRRRAASPRSAPARGAAGAGDQLHRLRDLARVADRADPPLDVLLGSHGLGAPGARTPGRDSSSTLKPCSKLLQLLVEAAVSSSESSFGLADLPVDRALRAHVLAQLVLEARHLAGRDLVQVAVDAGEDRHHLLLDAATGWYCGWLSVATIRSPRASVRCVAASSSEPNWANASSSRYWARSRREAAGDHRIAFIWALPPTRETEMPTLIAGRTPE